MNASTRSRYSVATSSSERVCEDADAPEWTELSDGGVRIEVSESESITIESRRAETSDRLGKSGTELLADWLSCSLSVDRTDVSACCWTGPRGLRE